MCKEINRSKNKENNSKKQVTKFSDTRIIKPWLFLEKRLEEKFQIVGKETKLWELTNSHLNKWNIFSKSNVRLNWRPGDEIENGTEVIFEEILVERLSNLMKDTKFRKQNTDSWAVQIKKKYVHRNRGNREQNKDK